LNLFKKSNGFTLIEVLVALVILSIALLSLAGLMATTTRNNSAGGHMTEAATVAQDALERLRLSPLNMIPTGVKIQDSFVGSTGIAYQRTWTAKLDPINPSNTFDEIDITVTWVDPIKLQNHSIKMVSGISQ